MFLENVSCALLEHLLLTGSEERRVFWGRSIPLAILPSCQYIYETVAS